MKHRILYKPSYAMMHVQLEPGERIIAEAGSMVGMSPNMTVKTGLASAHGSGVGFIGGLISFVWGFFGALIRKALGGESFFMNTFEPAGGPGEVYLAPAMVGDAVNMRLDNQTLMVRGASFLAATPDITIRTRFAGFWGFLSGEGLFLLECSGTGDLWLNSYGMIEEREMDGRYVVDTGHLVAFDTTLRYHVKSVGGLKSTLLSGEGLVIELVGQGRVLVQTRSVGGLVSWLSPLFPH